MENMPKDKNTDEQFMQLAVEQARIAEEFQGHYPDHEWADAC